LAFRKALDSLSRIVELLLDFQKKRFFVNLLFGCNHECLQKALNANKKTSFNTPTFNYQQTIFARVIIFYGKMTYKEKR